MIPNPIVTNVGSSLAEKARERAGDALIIKAESIAVWNRRRESRPSKALHSDLSVLWEQPVW